MKNILLILKHNIKSVMKNWFWLIIVFPLILGIGLKTMINNLDANLTKGVSIAVYTNDKSEIFDKIFIKDKFDEIKIMDSPKSVKEEVKNNNSIVGIVINSSDMYEDIKDGKGNIIEVISNEGTSEKNYVENIINSSLVALTSLGNTKQESLEYYKSFEDNKYEFNYEINDFVFVVFYMTTFGLFSLGFLMISARGLSPLLKEKEIKIDKRILVSRVSKVEYILGHVLGCFVLLMMQSLTLLSTFFILNKDFNVGFGWMFLISIALSITGIAVSLLVLSVSNNSATYYTLLTIIITPMSFLSGGLIPTEFLPEIVQKIFLISPLTWINEAFKKIMLNDTFGSVLMSLMASIAISVVLITLYLLLESRRKEKLV